MNVMLHDRFKARVREKMKLDGISQSELASRMDVSRQMIGQYLSDEAQCPSLDVVEKFAIALGLDDADYLLSRSSKRSRQVVARRCACK